MHKVSFNIQPAFWVLTAVFLLVIPLKWVVAWFVAAAVHELFHYIALRFCGCDVYDITIGVDGAKMMTEPLTGSKEAICSIAGPVGGLCLCFAASYFPVLAICGFLQSLYNLLPIYPMDGGRAVRNIAAHFFHYEKAIRICNAIEMSTIIALNILGIAAWLVLHFGPIPEVVAGLITLKNRKIPCKECG